jgi:Na+/H+-translocating membrane pyrophosphatase
MCLGGASGAVALSWLCYRLPSWRLVTAINGAACALLAALTTYPHAQLVLTPLAAGFLSTAAPLTSVFLHQPTIETVSDALQFAGRVGGLLALNLLYGVAFAMVGFLGVLLVTIAAPT